MRFVEYSEQYSDAYRHFLLQIDDALGEPPGNPFSYYLPSPDISINRHLVIDETPDGMIVVGAVDMKVQRYSVGGEIVRAAFVKYPVSLGIVNPKYASVGVFIFTQLAQVYPLNYLLGMGNPKTSKVAQLVEMMGWTLKPVPYFFLPVRLGPLVQQQVAGNALLARSARLIAALRLFRVGDALLRAALFWRRRRGDTIRVAPVTQFDESLDRFWREYSDEVGFSLVRDCTEMNSIFPSTIPQFKKLSFFQGDRIVGFAILLVPTAEAPVRFAGVRTITLVEVNFLISHLEGGVAALTRYILKSDFDAVIANTSHDRTIHSLKNCGFFERTTHFFLGTSKHLQTLLDKHDVELGDMILTRGDGDGPIGLGVDL